MNINQIDNDMIKWSVLYILSGFCVSGAQVEAQSEAIIWVLVAVQVDPTVPDLGLHLVDLGILQEMR